MDSQISFLRAYADRIVTELREMRRELQRINESRAEARRISSQEMRENLSAASREIELLSTKPECVIGQRAAYAKIGREAMPTVTIGQYVWMKQGEDGNPHRMLCTEMDSSTLFFREVGEDGNLIE